MSAAVIEARELVKTFGKLTAVDHVSFAIAPGEIDTSILSPGTDDIVQREIPMRRLGKPSEVAQLVYFLCTSQSSYVNGAEIHVNGGEHV